MSRHSKGAAKGFLTAVLLLAAAYGITAGVLKEANPLKWDEAYSDQKQDETDREPLASSVVPTIQSGEIVITRTATSEKSRVDFSYSLPDGTEANSIKAELLCPSDEDYSADYYIDLNLYTASKTVKLDLKRIFKKQLRLTLWSGDDSAVRGYVLLDYQETILSVEASLTIEEDAFIKPVFSIETTGGTLKADKEAKLITLKYASDFTEAATAALKAEAKGEYNESNYSLFMDHVASEYLDKIPFTSSGFINNFFILDDYSTRTNLGTVGHSSFKKIFSGNVPVFVLSFTVSGVSYSSVFGLVVDCFENIKASTAAIVF